MEKAKEAGRGHLDDANARHHKAHPLSKMRPGAGGAEGGGHQQGDRIQREEEMNNKHAEVLKERVEKMRAKIPSFASSVWGRGRVGGEGEGESGREDAKRQMYEEKKKVIEQGLSEYLSLEMQIMANRLSVSKEFEKIRGIQDKDERAAFLKRTREETQARREGDVKIFEQARNKRTEVEQQIDTLIGAGSEL